MGTGASTESQGIRNDTPAPTQSELAQITSAILANQQQQQQQQAQYVPPQASIYTPPEAQIYTPPAAQVAAPGITALLPQDQGAQTLAPNTLIPTPLTLSEPQASIYTPPASQVYTPEARPEPVPQDKFFTTPDHPAATAPQQAAPPTQLEKQQATQPATKAEEPAANPAELTESQKQRNYWSNEAPAFGSLMSAMENGTAQVKNVQIDNEYSELQLISPDGNSVPLRATPQEGVYQFSVYNPTAGGTITGVFQTDPKTGKPKPIQDYTKQIKYAPGQSGSVFGSMIGDLGDIYKSLGPIAPIIGNALAPGLGSALSAAAALDEGNTTGAILSGLSAAGAYGGDAARNALAAEVSGNADLASQYSSGLGGALAQNLPEIKTATSAAQLANALDKGNVLGAIGAGADLTGTQLPSDFRTGLAGLGLAQAIASGNVPQAMALGSQFIGPLSNAPGADVGPPAPAGISSLVPALQQEQQETPTDVQLAQNTELPPDTNAGLNQLIQAINNPESTASYTGTQVADLSGTAGLPSDEPTDQDLAQLGVGLPEVGQEPPPVNQVSPVSPGAYVPTDDGTTGGIEDLIKTLPASTETTDGGDGAFIGNYEDAGDGIAGPGGEGSFPGTEEGTVGSDQTTEGTDMDELGDFEGIDMTGGGAGEPVDALGDFEGIDMTGGGAGEPAKDDTGFEGVDMTGGGAGKTLGIFDQLSSATGLSPGLLKLLAGSLGLGGLGSLLGQQQPSAPAQTPYTGPLSNIQFNPAMYTPTTYKPYAGGGSVEGAYQDSQYTIPVGYPQNYPQTAPQMTAPMPNMAAGGIASLGGYSDGGRLLRGPGDGVSDSIPAVIGNKQPARLANNEFVIPARIVSELGNGSTDAGARELYKMMDRIQARRQKTMGKGKIAVDTKAYKDLPA